MSEELRLYMSKVLSAFEQYAKMSHHLAFEGLMSTLKLDDPDRVADILAAHLMVATTEKQSLLELLNPYERLQRLHDLLDVEIEKINIDKRINVKVKKQMEKAQKEYYLNEKIKAIHQELGRKDDRGDELLELREKIEKAGLPKEVKEKAEQELKRLEAMPPVSAEATVSRNYIDWLVAVPWRKKSKERKDLDHAEQVLNEDHYGLEKIKDRILEFLAVRQLVGQTKSSIICFVGPPGVGKSSLAKSIARATGRKFVRLSLGGVRDEAEIRGHRRTYIGAFPGQIIQMMRKAGTINPVFLLDEVDKMSMDFRGDPSAALLEVLDPEQNDSFMDHYLDVDYDLSKVMFIATANVIHTIPPPLRDRMEIIQLSGYTLNEKLAIAQQFLVPRQLKDHGLSRDKIRFDEEAIRVVIESYTREAGVRSLEREIASICRKIARRVVKEGSGDRDPRGAGDDLRAARQAEVPRPAQERGVGGRRRHRPGLDRGWRRAAGDRGRADAGQGQADADRQAGRGDAGVGPRGRVVPAQPRRDAGHRAGLQREPGHPPARAGGGDPQGRALGGHHHGDRPGLGPDQEPGPQGRGDDRRDHAAGQGSARGGHQGQGAGRVPRRHHRGRSCRAENEKDLEEIPGEVREAMEFHLVESMDEVLRLALDGQVSPLPKKGSFEEASAEPPVGSDSLAH